MLRLNYELLGIHLDEELERKKWNNLYHWTCLTGNNKRECRMSFLQARFPLILMNYRAWMSEILCDQTWPTRIERITLKKNFAISAFPMGSTVYNYLCAIKNASTNTDSSMLSGSFQATKRPFAFSTKPNPEV